MSALIRKEVRMILPAWVLAMVLATAPVWLLWPEQHYLTLPVPGPLVFGPFFLGVLLLGLAPIGLELAQGTFAQLLAQPVSRKQLWMVKLVVLTVALLLVFAALCLSTHLRVDSMIETMKTTTWHNAFRTDSGKGEPQFVNMIAEFRAGCRHTTIFMGLLASLAALSGGLWSTLLFRQASVAFWLSLLLPIGLGLLVTKLTENFPISQNPILMLVIGLYSLGGVLWARSLFLQGQDTAWTGDMISLPSWGASASSSATSSPRLRRKPLAALLRKEIQLQQANFIIAASLMVVQVVVLLFRKLDAAYLQAHPSTSIILESFPLLWFALPVLIGSVTIAEERKQGTLEGALCLPTRRWLQFLVKLCTAMVLAALLGGALPLLFSWLSVSMGLRGEPAGLAWDYNVVPVARVLGFACGGFTLLAMYGSSLTRNSFQALGAAVGAMIIAANLVIWAVTPLSHNGVFFWRGPLIGYIAVPVFTVTLLWLAYGNFKQVQLNLSVWWQNARRLLCAGLAVIFLTTFVYHRAWEAWLPEEPQHRFIMDYANTAKTHFRTAPKLQSASFRTMLVLPDGRLWVRQRNRESMRWTPDPHGALIPSANGPWREGFVSGSTWADLALSESACFALKADGSLWDLSDIKVDRTGVISEPKPFGPAGPWKSLAVGQSDTVSHFLALKSDGTLWQWVCRDPMAGQRQVSVTWGTPYYDLEIKPGAVTQIGSDGDWVGVGQGSQSYAAVKADGTIWRSGPGYTVNNGTIKLTERPAVPELWLHGPSRRPISISLTSFSIAIIYEDGTLWLGGHLGGPILKADAQARAMNEMVQLGQEHDWKQVLLGWENVVALNEAGWVWQSDPREMFGIRLSRPAPLTIASRFAGWAAVSWADGPNDWLAFHADGTLCQWKNRRSHYWEGFNGPDPRLLLLPTRIHTRLIAQVLP